MSETANPSRHVVATSLSKETYDLVSRTARAYNTSASAILSKALELFFAERPDIVEAVSSQPALPEL